MYLVIFHNGFKALVSASCVAELKWKLSNNIFTKILYVKSLDTFEDYELYNKFTK